MQLFFARCVVIGVDIEFIQSFSAAVVQGKTAPGCVQNTVSNSVSNKVSNTANITKIGLVSAAGPGMCRKLGDE